MILEPTTARHAGRSCHWVRSCLLFGSGQVVTDLMGQGRCDHQLGAIWKRFASQMDGGRVTDLQHAVYGQVLRFGSELHELGAKRLSDWDLGDRIWGSGGRSWVNLGKELWLPLRVVGYRNLRGKRWSKWIKMKLAELPVRRPHLNCTNIVHTARRTLVMLNVTNKKHPTE